MTPLPQPLAALLDGTLAPAGFGHRAHVQAAYQALTLFDFDEALYRYSRGLKQVVARAGVPEKFNASLTWLFMATIAERRAAAPHAGFDSFIAANGDLLERGFIARHYSPERLAAPLARQIPLVPDRYGSA